MEDMSKTVEIDGWKYLITHPDPEEAWKVGIELGKLIAVPAASIAMASSAKNESVMGDALPGVIKNLISNLHAEESLGLIKRILRYVEVQGKTDGSSKRKMEMTQDVFKTHFRGRMGSVVKLVGECIAFQHADFFSAIGGGIATMMEKAVGKAA